MKRFITAIFLFSACVVFTMQAQNALERSLSDIKYAAEVQSVVSAKHTSPDNGQFSNAPFWFQANKHGFSSVNADNGRLRLSVSKDIDMDWRDNMYKWNVGYGIDVATAYNYQQSVIVQQLYADIQWKWLRLSVGSKERPMELKNNDLSSGSQTFGINAKPIPQVRLEVPEYVYFSSDLDWFGIKGHFGYGMLTDGGFQERYLTPGLHYVSKARFHTKAGYVRLGNEYSFPLSFDLAKERCRSSRVHDRSRNAVCGASHVCKPLQMPRLPQERHDGSSPFPAHRFPSLGGPLPCRACDRKRYRKIRLWNRRRSGKPLLYELLLPARDCPRDERRDVQQPRRQTQSRSLA